MQAWRSKIHITKLMALVIAVSMVLTASLLALQGTASAVKTGSPFTIEVPSRPMNLSAEMNAWGMTLEWQVPLYDGGSPIEWYVIDAKASDPINWTESWRAYGTSLSFLSLSFQLDLIGGWEYHFNVSACNRAGKIGPRSGITVTPLFAPLTPRNLTALPGDGFLNLTWSPPLLDGGSPILRYDVHRFDRDSSWNIVGWHNVSVTGTTFNDTQLSDGIVYEYEVMAVNAIGEGWHEWISSIIAGAPSPPRDLKVTGGPDRADLSWSPPETDCGSPILEYRVIRYYSSINATVAAPLTNYSDTSTNRQMFEYSVVAVNAWGESMPSEAVWGPPHPPESPSVEAIQGDGFVKLTWSYPFSGWGVPPPDGASPIIGHEIHRHQYNESSGQNHSWYNTSVTTTTFNDTNVINGERYIYGVVAVNAIGESPESFINVTPGRPSAPLLGHKIEGENFINFTWSPPLSDGGSPLISYQIYRNNGSGSFEPYATPAPSSTFFNDTGVSPGHHYDYLVFAENVIGESDWFAHYEWYRPGPPPLGLQAEAGIGFVNLTWSPPPSGTPYTYTVFRLIENRTDETSYIWWNGTYYNDTAASGLLNGVAYGYYVTAMTESGESVPSELVTVTPGGPDLLFVGAIGVSSGTVEVDAATLDDLVTLHLTLKNEGTSPVHAAKVRLSAVDVDSFITPIATITRDLLPGQGTEIEVFWWVNVTAGAYTLKAEADPSHLVDELNESNNNLTRPFAISAPIPSITVEADKGSVELGGDMMITGHVLNSVSSQPLAGIVVKLQMLDAGSAPVGDNLTVATDSSGYFAGLFHVPANAQDGSYTIKATVEFGNLAYSNSTSVFDVEAGPSNNDMLLIITGVLAIGVVIAVAAIIMIRKKR